MLTMKMWKAAIVAASVMCVTGAHAGTSDPKPKELKRAVQAFLADHGDLCLAMYTWPRDVTAEDRESNSNEAVQMPVLERLGVVQSTELQPELTKRYSLTDEGQQYFLRKTRTTLDIHSQPEQH